MGAKKLEDFHLVAITSVLAKCMERVISYHFKPYVSEHLDALRFAYKPQRATEDATLTTDRPQQVCVRGVKSDIMFSNTGAPQGCILSPLLFSV